MPRYYHDGSQNEVPSIVKHPQFGHVLRVPKALQSRYGVIVQAKPGSVVLALSDVGLFLCEPGGSVDVPVLSMDPKLDQAQNEARTDEIVKAHAPQLLTEQEAIDKGLLQPRALERADKATKPPKGN